MLACAKAGAILHPISWRLAPAEVAFQLDDAQPDRFLVSEEHRKLGDAARSLRSSERLESGSRSESDSSPPSGDDPLPLIYTGGTTGKPKGGARPQAERFWAD